MAAPKSNRATLADVASHAGVSVATASYVLSERENVSISEVTRARVRESAAELGYRRNALAASLRTGLTNQIAILCAGRPAGLNSEVLLAFAEAAGTRNLSPVLQLGSTTDFEPSRFDGVIVIGNLAYDPKLQVALTGPTPLVSFANNFGSCQIHADDFGGARRAVEHLYSLGHRRIGHLAGPQNEPAAQERLRGFLDGVHEAGLRMDASPVIHTLNDLHQVLSAANRPTGLVAYDDRSALNVYGAARAIGLSLPFDLSVVGFGDEIMAEGLEPALTTLRIGPELVAGSALALLDQQRLGHPVPGQTLVPTTLIVRSSSMPPR